MPDGNPGLHVLTLLVAVDLMRGWTFEPLPGVPTERSGPDVWMYGSETGNGGNTSPNTKSILKVGCGLGTGVSWKYGGG
jgi:hypothetical protein